MFEQLVIEPARFARDGRQLRGALAVASLPRLAEQLDGSGGAVDYEVVGYVTAKGHPALHLTVAADVDLVCQRCLGRLNQRLESQRDIVLVPDADEFAQVNDEAESEDVIPEVARLDLRDLVEDELLLVMPLAPHHAEGACSPPQDRHAGEHDVQASSPFAMLSQLKKP